METLAPNRPRVSRGSGPVWRELTQHESDGQAEERGTTVMSRLLVFLDYQGCAKYNTGTDFN